MLILQTRKSSKFKPKNWFKLLLVKKPGGSHGALSSGMVNPPLPRVVAASVNLAQTAVHDPSSYSWFLVVNG